MKFSIKFFPGCFWAIVIAINLILFVKSPISIIQSRMMSICPSVSLKLKISVTTEPIGLDSYGYLPIGPVVVLSYFLEGWDTPNPPKNKLSPLQILKKKFRNLYEFAICRFPTSFAIHSHFFRLGQWVGNRRCNYTSWGKVPRG